MKIIGALFPNSVLNVAFVAWAAAQILKTILNFIKTSKFHPERLVGAGGMPSAHSAAVCGMTIAIVRSVGLESPLFAMSFLFAGIVMYDAMGVRRAAGEQAKVINMIVRKSESGELSYTPKKKGELKEFLGHTPLEVLGGALLGILVAMIMPY